MQQVPPRKDSKCKALRLLFCVMLLSMSQVVAQEIFQCPLCGEGKEMTDYEGTVSVPQNGDFGCGQLVNFAAEGAVDRQTCSLLETLTQVPCGCVELQLKNTTTPTVEPPAVSQNFGPDPDCYEDLNMVNQRELALSSKEVGLVRTYVLCPDTIFFMGRLNPSGGFDGGFDAIIPRPNVHYKCGDDGSSTNNCRLLDGTFPIISFGGDAEHTNVIFEGLTIESSASGGVLAATPGDLTFIDCIFKNHKNIGPVHILFDSPIARRLTSANAILSYSRGATNNKLHDEDNQKRSRQLQGSEPLTTLTITFTRCLFTGNEIVENLGNMGMVTSVTPQTVLVFDDVTFYNNNYGDQSSETSSAAIVSRGPLIVQNTCFLENSFSLDAPIVSIGGSSVDIRNTHIDNADEALTCSLAASYADQSAWESGDVAICVEPDVNACQSTVPITPPAPSPPGSSPIDIPGPQVTLSPVQSPTTTPVTRGGGGGSSGASRTALFSFLLTIQGALILAL